MSVLHIHEDHGSQYEDHLRQPSPTSQTLAASFGLGGPVKIPLEIRRLTPRERAELAFILEGTGGRGDASLH
jgi:hypothetical protein